MVSLTPLSRFSRRHPLLSLALTLVALVAFVGFALLTGTPVVGQSHTLEAVAVDNTGLEPRSVEVQVRRGGQTLVHRTVEVPAAVSPTPTGNDSVATGIGVAGTATVTDGWSGAGVYTVRAQLVGRDAWVTVDLERVDERNDEPWWHLGRDYEGTNCYVVRVLVGTDDPAGVSARAANCGVG
jgi:hypothetical protein